MKFYMIFELLSEKNYFQLINCESLREHEQEIMGYTETFQVRGMEVPLKCLEDNINQMEYLSDHEFFWNAMRMLL